MADRGLLWSVGRPPPPQFSLQALDAPRRALFLHWALQSLTLTSLLQQKLPPQVHLLPKQKTGFLGFSSAKLTHGDGDVNAGNFIRPPSLARGLTVRFLAVALLFGGPFVVFRALMSSLPPDFSQRWRNFFEEHYRNEPLASCKKRKMGSIIYDVHGEVITTIGVEYEPCLLNSGSPRGKPSDIPAFLWQAVVACEDRRFFQHSGVDPRGLARAALSLSTNGGGSTITQQLVKNVFLTIECKWTRKVLEMVLALILETKMSKWDILRMYLKKIYWGHGLYGIEAASDFYFGKELSLLNVGECAMLAGMIPAPELYSPFHDPSRGKRAQARALRRMVEAGFLDVSYAETTINGLLQLSNKGQDGKRSPCRAPFFVDEVLKDLKERYGCSNVLEGGLKVYTTLDLHMQEHAEGIVKEWVARFDSQRISSAEMAVRQMQKKLEELQTARNFVINKVTSKIYLEQGLDQDKASKLAEQAVAKIDNNISTRKHALQESLENFQEELKAAVEARLEAAITAIDPMDGAVRVLVGGRDYLESSFNRSTKAYRPPGSTFKPVVYLTALAEKINRKDMLRDECCIPAIFSQKRVDGKRAVAEPLVGSLSEPCVKLCAKVGPDKVCRMGNLLGIETPLPHDPMVALGGFKVTPMQLATVYSTIAAGGIHHKPFFITRVETGDGEVLEEVKTSKAVRVVDEHAVSELHKLLQANIQKETGQNARIRRPCAGKTSTSEGHRDVWFAGFTPDVSCVVWLGYDDNSSVGGLHPGTGASHAAPVWKHFIDSAYKEQPVKYFKNKAVGRSAMKFSRKSFKLAKIRVKLQHKISRQKQENTDGRPMWKDVWDWDEASSVWDERESMVEWSEKHLKRAAKVNAFKRFWS